MVKDMKTLEELKVQFDREEKEWKSQLNKLADEHKAIMSSININDDSFETFMKKIDDAIEKSRQINELDTRHKDFLLKWKRCFDWHCLFNLFKN